MGTRTALRIYAILTLITATWLCSAGAANAATGLVWSTFLGGNGTDNVVGTFSDGSGNVYVVGSTTSTNFPVTAGAVQGTLRGGTDAFIAKMRSDGSGLAWSTLLGGSATDIANAVRVDGNGNVYVCGYTNSADFPTTAGAYRTTRAGSYDAFICKFSSTGALTFSTYLGGAADENARALAVNSAGEVLVAGFTGSVDFPTTAGVVRPTRTPATFDASDGFLAKLSSNGSSLVFGTYIGSNADMDAIYALALDLSGSPVVAGYTKSTTFPTSTGAFMRTYSGNRMAFVTKLNASASAYVFSTFLGGLGEDTAYGLAVDPLGNVYVTGNTTSSNFPVSSSAFQRAWGGGQDAFITKLNPTGSALVFSSYYGGTGTDEGTGVVIGSNGQAVLTGSTDSPNLTVQDGAALGGRDVYALAISADGSRLTYSTRFGGISDDADHAAATFSNGRVLCVGSTTSIGFPTTLGAFSRTLASTTGDGFVTSVDLGLSSSGSTAVAGLPQWGLQLEAPAPNPFRNQSVITLALDRTERVKVDVVDVQGRPVRALADETLAAGRHTWTWNGAMESGRRAEPGMYFVRVSCGGTETSQRLVLID